MLAQAMAAAFPPIRTLPYNYNKTNTARNESESPAIDMIVPLW